MRRWLGIAACTAVLAIAGLGQAPPPAAGSLSPEQLQQLVAPIALYPDAAVAQMLAAATYPDEIQAANAWLQANGRLNGQALADAVNGQPDWDPSIKALCEYPTVLGMMAQNLTWTSQLGDAYYNQPDDVMTAVQVMRQRAWDAGVLRSTSQQTVVRNADGTITITPADPNTFYVPMYDPWLCFGPAFTPWYPWIFPPGWGVGIGLRFGPGFGLGFWTRFPWAMPVWGTDWHAHRVIYGHAPYVTHSPVMVDHRILHPAPAGAARVGVPGRPVGRAPGMAARPEVKAPAPPRPAPNRQVNRGFTPPPARPAQGTRTSAFSGFGAGGGAAGAAMHGGASMAAPRAAPAGGGRGRGK